MPFYDRACLSCGWQKEDCFEPIESTRACPQCGTATERAWFSKTANVIGDECDFVSHNGAAKPIRFRSKQDHKRWLKANGYRILDAHVGTQGSDKNRHSSSANVITATTLENAKILVERASAPVAHEGALGITSFEGLTRYLADKRSAARGDYA